MVDCVWQGVYPWVIWHSKQLLMMLFNRTLLPWETLTTEEKKKTGRGGGVENNDGNIGHLYWNSCWVGSALFFAVVFSANLKKEAPIGVPGTSIRSVPNLTVRGQTHTHTLEIREIKYQNGHFFAKQNPIRLCLRINLTLQILICEILWTRIPRLQCPHIKYEISGMQKQLKQLETKQIISRWFARISREINEIIHYKK